MAEKIKINGIEIKQPLKGLGYDFQTVYSSESARVQSGRDYTTPVATIETFTYSAANMTAAEMSQILQLVMKGGAITLHYFSPYYGYWRDDTFIVKSGSLKVNNWIANEERYDSLSFKLEGVNPV